MDGVGIGIFRIFIELEGIHELASYLDNLSPAVKNILPIIGAIVCIYGLLQCFLGYKLFKFWCGVVGLLVGVLVGEAIVTSGVLTNTPGAYLLGLLIILLLALTGAFVAYRAYMVGLFLYSFIAAFLIVFYLIMFFIGSPIAGLITGIIAGVAMGVVAVIFKRFWIIVSTSVYGGISVCTGMMMILLSADLGWFYVLPPVFAVAGFIVQHNTVKKTKKAGAATTHQVYVTHVAPAYPESQQQTPPVSNTTAVPPQEPPQPPAAAAPTEVPHTIAPPETPPAAAPTEAPPSDNT